MATAQKTKDTVVRVNVAVIGTAIFDRIAGTPTETTTGTMTTAQVCVPAGRSEGDLCTTILPNGVKAVYVVPPKSPPGTVLQISAPSASVPDAFSLAQFEYALKQDKELEWLIRATAAVELKNLLSADKEALTEYVQKLSGNEEDLSVSRARWMSRMVVVRQDEVNHYRSFTMLRGKRYSGMGLTPGGARFITCYPSCGLIIGNTAPPKFDLPICTAEEGSNSKCFWENFFFRGYWSDFAFFTLNNHPLCVMFFSDALHPYSEDERKAAFAGSFFTSFFGAGLMVILKDVDPVAKFFISAIFVSIPSTIISQLCYYLFAQPCLLRDRSKTSGCANCIFDCCGSLGTKLGKIIVCAWSLAFGIIGIALWVNAEAADLAYWGYGLGQFWFVWFFNMFFIDFFPFSFGRKLKILRTISCGTFKIGQWLKERDTFLSLVREKIKTRGRLHFAVPGSPREAEADLEAGASPTPQAMERGEAAVPAIEKAAEVYEDKAPAVEAPATEAPAAESPAPEAPAADVAAS